MATKTRELYLSHVSGLRVLRSFDPRKSQHFYEFVEPISGNVLCAAYCYKKAKLFALGVDAGRKLSKKGN